MIRDFAWITVAYVVAILAAGLTLPFVTDYHVLVQVLIADVIATGVVFAFSLVFRNSSFYDAYWSVAPVVIAFYFLWLTEAIDVRALMVTLVVTLWAVRLTGNWAYGWQGLRHEDWRYVNLAETTGIFWWPVSFLGIHLFPTVIVFLGCIALYPAIVTGENPLGVVDAFALVLGLGAVWLEFQADRELHRFRAVREGPHEVLDTGVWSWCRHPNYLGEIGFWFSVYFFGYAATGVHDRWMQSGPVAMVLLFVIVSIPMIEKKLAADKPAYEAYKARSYALLPLSRLRASGANP